MRLLLVEDEARIATFLTKGLGRNGFQTEWVDTGSAALTRAGGHDRPEIVLLDLGLPDIDGLDVLRAIHQIDRHLPVVVLTARTDPSVRRAALDLGAHDYLTKPVALADLVARLVLAVTVG